MSLINDALRRASQSERNRPLGASTRVAMEPAPAARSSGLSVLLVVAILVALGVAGWLFWQLWNGHGNPGSTVVVANPAPPLTQAPVVAPKTAPITPAAPANPAPVPVVVAAPPVAALPVAAPPSVTQDTQVVWPVDLTLSAVFFSKTNPRVLINGNLYGVGDTVQGVLLTKIEKDEVTVEWNGHSKVLMLGGQ
jgi:hypothetical protein